MKFSFTLLVDDDSTSNLISERILSKTNLTEKVHVTWNGKEAIDYIVSSIDEGNDIVDCPDFILLDINMPIMDGFEFLDAFQKIDTRGKDIKIVMLTSSIDRHDMETSKKYPIHGYITKPLTFEKLLSAVEQL
ncbi:MAG: response regulator [Bacteroidota bacterium]